MSALFNVCVPFEVVAAIQRGEGVEQALQTLSITQDMPTRMVTDIARGVVAQVNAMPYSVTLKSLSPSAPAFAPAPAQDPTGFGDDMPSAPASPFTDPFVNDVKPIILTPDTPSLDGDREIITFDIYDPTTDDSLSFRTQSDKIFECVATAYAGRFDLDKSAFTFTCEDGLKISLYDELGWLTTLASVGIREGTTIIAERSAVEMNVTFRDTMMKDKTLTFNPTNMFAYVAHRYAHHGGLSSIEQYTFTVHGSTYDCGDHDQSEITLEDMEVHDGDVIMVKPKVDESYMITFTVRDAMNREEVFEMKHDSFISSLKAKYCDIADLRTDAVQFEIDGCEVAGGPQYGFTIEEASLAGIYEGAVITVQLRKPSAQKQAFAVKGKGLPCASGFGFDGSRRGSTPVESEYGGGWGRSTKAASVYDADGW
ncbi:hypothetical protein LTR56_008276 [Elasticomyces elasticus]|nr:hypothetical protein LTR56_008276 [Elasticomyces elasticus]KAK3661839.1 hypothetical protein LTR22_007422 [Elasticomyces elasticus]KAK4924443.1 hypothetical protein LTR49_008534 [Elasticomyces elasticus]KAK5762592.1 hypothetical protein LTS12_007182 [Elasticomyces elasticus]